MDEKLTPQQQMAVKNRGGKLLVSAAAGSGKTKVLVDRLMDYLTDAADPADLDDFLIITYTKMAASELRGKIAAKLTQRIAQEPENRHLQKQMQRLFLTHISTVHSFCADVLREYAYKLEISPDFRVADEEECRELQELVMKDLLDHAYTETENQEAFRYFVDSQGVGRNDGKIPEIISQVYRAAKCHLDPQGWLDTCLQNARPQNMEDAGQTVWGRYLMEDLHTYLSQQIAVLKQCTQEASCVEGFAKVADNLNGTIVQLQALLDSTLWDEIIAKRNVKFGVLRFPKSNNALELTDEIKAVRDACKVGLEKKLKPFTDDTAKNLIDLQQSFLAAQGLVQLVNQFDANYSAAKRSKRILDFSDLEHGMLQLLYGKSRRSTTVAAREIGQRFREIMVDEYQDSNAVQDAIFSALTQERQNCFMVGDVKQSIYQFRLADPGIFLEKYNSYASAEEAQPGQGRKVLLSHNFRSGGEVIEAVNHVFAACMSRQTGGLDYGEAEALREGVPHKLMPDPAVELHVLETGEDAYAGEAAFTAKRISTMLNRGTLIRDGDEFRPVKAEDIVILLRSPGSVGISYQRALESYGIRCAMYGGLDLLQTEEISALRSFLQVIANPRQDIPLIGALASPLFGFHADDLAYVRSGNKKDSFYDALKQSELPKAREFCAVLESLREHARTVTLTQLMEDIFLSTRLDSIYGAMKGGKAKKDNLQTFFQMAADYERTGLRTLDQFLEHLDAISESGLRTADSSAAGCVTIMSIHKSKGLEFPVVFLCGLSRKFNMENLYDTILCDKDLGLGLSVADTQQRVRYSSLAKRAIAASKRDAAISEEMRVLYVAMTRARDRLIMTYAKKNPTPTLEDIALRLRFDGGKLLCQEADCPGDWILTAAITRMEAGALHAIGGRPASLQISDYPWLISVESVTGEEGSGSLQEENASSCPVSEREIREALRFQYPFRAATVSPSKQTATGKKGRTRDEEAAEETPEPKKVVRTWRRPSFQESVGDGRAYGTAFHTAMQFIRYEACTSQSDILEELARLERQGLLKQEQLQMIDSRKIAAFFESSYGKKLVSGVSCLREFKFSILDDGAKYEEALAGEKILLQGVVDCAIVEPDGITVVDFKTDRITPDAIEQSADRYRDQLQIYANALERIYEAKVKETVLYYVHLNQFVQLK